MLRLIDPPSPYAPVTRWRAFLKELAAMPQSQQVRLEIKYARRMLALKMKHDRQAAQRQA
jgi:hypothetical protein